MKRPGEARGPVPKSLRTVTSIAVKIVLTAGEKEERRGRAKTYLTPRPSANGRPRSTAHYA